MTIAFVHGIQTATTSPAGAVERALRLYRGVIATFLGVVVAITILLSVFSIAAPKNSVGPSIFGHQMLVVRSGSMGPIFHTGSIVAIKSVDAADADNIEEGTIVAFRSLANPDILITHRVVSRLTPVTKYTIAGTAQFLTKGDANLAEDGTILTASRIVGTYSFSVPRAGYAIVAIEGGRLLFSLLVAFMFASIALMLSQWAHKAPKSKEIQ